jgi:hypothetical protein
MPTLINRMNPRDFQASFLSCEKDLETIINKLFVQSKPYSDILKRLLIIDQPDCLDSTNSEYQQLINQFSIHRMKEEHYILTVPRIEELMHEDFKSRILVEFDDFIESGNTHYRDCTISFTIVSPLVKWELDDYKLRPMQIAGYIDGILNNTRLSGIGTLQFMGASQIILDKDHGGIMLRYIATHGNDDKDSFEEAWPLS